MAIKEIDDAEYAALIGIQTRVNQVLKDPKARPMLLKAIKQADPNAAIPELDAAEPVNAAVEEALGQIKAMRDELTAERQARAEVERINAFQAKWAEQDVELRARGWRPDGVAAIHDFAEKNGIADLMIAADAWEKRNPPVEVQASSQSLWGLFGDAPNKEDTFVEDMMKAGGNDDRRLDREIREAIADARAAR